MRLRFPQHDWRNIIFMRGLKGDLQVYWIGWRGSKLGGVRYTLDTETEIKYILKWTARIGPFGVIKFLSAKEQADRFRAREKKSVLSPIQLTDLQK